MKSMRSPLAIAAAALIGAPPALAQPLRITPPPEQPAEPQAPEPIAPDTAPVAAPAAPQPPSLAQARLPESAEPPVAAEAEAPAELRGPSPAPERGGEPQQQAEPQQTPAPEAPGPVQAAEQSPAPSRRLAPVNASVSIGEQEGFTRLAFAFPSATSVTPTLQGNQLDLRFSRAADIDLAELLANPPRYVREARLLSRAGQPVRLRLMLAAGARERHFVEGGRVVVDVLAPEGGHREEPAQTAAGERLPPVPATAPVSGTASVRVVEEASVTRVTVTWPAPARAAAFRRGEAIWMVFDATGRIDLGGVNRAGRRHRDIEVVRGENVIGLRVAAPPEIQVSAAAEESSWTFTLGARGQSAAHAALSREVAPDGRGRLIARFGREGHVRWLNDPEIGDRIAVALIGGPAKGVDVRRATVEAAMLPAAHGAVVEPRADGVSAAFISGDLIVTRGDGLIAAPLEAALGTEMSAAELEAAMRASGPGSGEDLAEVRERIDALMRAAAAEGVGEGAPADARMALARYLLEHDFAPEALGALRIVAINQGELVEIDPEFRLMRGAANVMMGRVEEAMPDLDASALADDAAAALWRGYAAAEREEWDRARRELERGIGALEEFPPSWRVRFQLALANAAFELSDFPSAEAAARAAMAQAGDRHMRLQARLLEARIAAARGDNERALAALDEMARVRDEEIAVAATVEALRIRRRAGITSARSAVDPLEALRFRWRGDATEIEVVALLGDAYSELGRWRDALSSMSTVADRYPGNLAARRLRADMTTLFERLFLDGEADQLEPIQALGLFYEFSDLTPVGPNGDRIVRLLSGRLVHVDLLEQAAALLQHQVDERLQGMSKAEVGADLAAIYLMDRKPDRALVAIASTRQPNMPDRLLADRRVLEARALLDLGRLDGAVELVERDRGADAQRVRADAAWRARDWERAAVQLRALLAMHDRALPLEASDRQAVLRAAIAMTLNGEDAAVRTLYRDYAGDMAGTPEADPSEIVAAGVHAEGAAIRDVARAVARSDLLDRFLQAARTRITAEAAAAAQPQDQPAPQPQPQAEAAPARESGAPAA